MARDARPEGSPYPKADLTLRGLARAIDLVLAFVLANTAHQVGPLVAVFYLLAADGFMQGQSVGKRIFGIRAVVISKRAGVGYRESILRNAPFALIAVFYSVPWGWILLILAGIPILAFESYMVITDRLGIRIGDIFADSQVVDGKVLSRSAAMAGTDLTVVAPTPPTSSRAAA